MSTYTGFGSFYPRYEFDQNDYSLVMNHGATAQSFSDTGRKRPIWGDTIEKNKNRKLDPLLDEATNVLSRRALSDYTNTGSVMSDEHQTTATFNSRVRLLSFEKSDVKYKPKVGDIMFIETEPKEIVIDQREGPPLSTMFNFHSFERHLSDGYKNAVSSMKSIVKRHYPKALDNLSLLTDPFLMERIKEDILIKEEKRLHTQSGPTLDSRSLSDFDSVEDVFRAIDSINLGDKASDIDGWYYEMLKNYANQLGNDKIKGTEIRSLFKNISEGVKSLSFLNEHVAFPRWNLAGIVHGTDIASNVPSFRYGRMVSEPICHDISCAHSGRTTMTSHWNCTYPIGSTVRISLEKSEKEGNKGPLKLLFDVAVSYESSIDHSWLLGRVEHMSNQYIGHDGMMHTNSSYSNGKQKPDTVMILVGY